MEELNPEELSNEILDLEDTLMDIIEVMSHIDDMQFFPIHLEINGILRRLEHLEMLQSHE